jgi:hypothetical protein
MASHMFVRYGKEEGDGFIPFEELTENLREFQGADNAFKIMALDIDSPEQKPEVIDFKQNNNDKLFEYHETSTQNNIRKVFTVPTVFLDAIAGTLGLQSQLDDAVLFYNRMTQDERAIIEEAYKFLFSDIIQGSFKIKELTMSEVVNGGEGVNLDAEAAEKVANAQAQLRGSVGGVTALITLQQSIGAGTTSIEAGIAMLREIYGFNDVVAREMLQGIKEPVNPAIV